MHSFVAHPLSTLRQWPLPYFVFAAGALFVAFSILSGNFFAPSSATFVYGFLTTYLWRLRHIRRVIIRYDYLVLNIILFCIWMLVLSIASFTEWKMLGIFSL